MAATTVPEIEKVYIEEQLVTIKPFSSVLNWSGGLLSNGGSASGTFGSLPPGNLQARATLTVRPANITFPGTGMVRLEINGRVYAVMNPWPSGNSTNANIHLPAGVHTWRLVNQGTAPVVATLTINRQ